MPKNAREAALAAGAGLLIVLIALVTSQEEIAGIGGVIVAYGVITGLILWARGLPARD